MERSGVALVKIADIIVVMKGLQFVTVLIILSLLILPFYLASDDAVDTQAISSETSQGEFLSASDTLFDHDLFVVSNSRDLSQEDERESLEHGQIIPFLEVSVIAPTHFIHPQNTSIPPAVTISRDTPPPRLFA